MLIVTTNEVPGKNLEVLGLVQGSVVQSKHMGKDITAGFKNLVGGEVKSYTEMMNEARGIATQRMAAAAGQMNADAVVAVRFASASIMQGTAEMLCYGTAVRFI